MSLLSSGLTATSQSPFPLLKLKLKQAGAALLPKGLTVIEDMGSVQGGAVGGGQGIYAYRL
jgi:hypothetical protein